MQIFAPAWEFFNFGGWGMYPILVWLVLTVCIVIERSFVLFRISLSANEALAEKLKSRIFAGELSSSLRLCRASSSPLARILYQGIENLSHPDSRVIQGAVDSAWLRESPRILARTPYLPVLGNLAVLSGILGTMTGLVRGCGCYGGESVDPSLRVRILAEGISEAMHCTAFGLGTGILTIIAYSILSSRTQAIEDQIFACTVETINLAIPVRRTAKQAFHGEET